MQWLRDELDLDHYLSYQVVQYSSDGVAHWHGMTWGQWQIVLWTSAIQTSLSIDSEKSSFLRKMLLRYWYCYRKNIWQLKNIWKNQFGEENNSCPEFDFTSSRVLQIFSGAQIFLILKFQFFEPRYLKKDHFSEFLTYWTLIPLTQGSFCHMSSLWDIFLPLFDFRRTV